MSDNPAIALPWPPKLCKPNGSHGHWRPKANAKRAYREACCIATMEVRHRIRLPEQGRLIVTLECYPPTNAPRRDADNLVASMKSGFDGVADALHVDDERFRIEPPVFKEAKGREAVVLMTITPDPADATSP